MRNALLLVLLSIWVAHLTGQDSPRSRPNILFIITDDHSWLHTSITGSKTVKTPYIDQIAREGILFNHGYVPTPSCTPARAAILTGQEIWRLEEGASLHGPLATKFAVYPDILEKAGYHVGFTGKGWAPGEFAIAGRVRNPSGTAFNRHKTKDISSALSSIDYAANFNEFINTRQSGQPFCFWVGFFEPHRPYKTGAGRESGMNGKLMNYPSFYPDVPEIRNDMLDYLYEIQYADNQIGRILNYLKISGELDNTLIVVTGDNGMPFPRAKGTLYDYGVRVPLVLRWGNQCKGGMVVDDFVSLTDLAPTFLEAAGLPQNPDMTGKSLIKIINSGQSGRIEAERDRVFFGRERHAICRPEEDENDPGYPARAIRTAEYLYIRNYAPYRWPHGDATFQSPQGFLFGDTDAGPATSYLIQNRDRPAVKPYFDLCFGKRPAEELYDVVKDPDQIHNLAQLPEYEEIKKDLRNSLEAYQTQTKDPRMEGKNPWDYYPYYTNNPAGLVPFRKSLVDQQGGIYITHGGVLGQAASTTMDIWARTSAPGGFFVRYGLDKDNLTLGISRTTTLGENDNTGWVRLEGLQPGTCYFYQVATDNYQGTKGSFFTLPAQDTKSGLSFEFGQGFYPLPTPWIDPEIPAAVIRGMNDTVYFGIKTKGPSQSVSGWQPFEKWLREDPLNARYHRNIPTFFPSGEIISPQKTGNYSQNISNCLFLFPDPKLFRTVSDITGKVVYEGIPEKTQQAWMLKEINQSRSKYVFIASPNLLFDPSLTTQTEASADMIKDRKTLLKNLSKTKRQIIFLSEDAQKSMSLKLLPRVWEIATRSETQSPITTETPILPEVGKNQFNGLKYNVLWTSTDNSYCNTQVKPKAGPATVAFRNSVNGRLLYSFRFSD
ncbi:MAG: sulfatase-like hydrolase/transferase [Bacteroidia bacterium]